jgi:hypothetical protein
MLALKMFKYGNTKISMKNKYSIKEFDESFEVWDKLIFNSKQCSIYLSSLYLNNINRKVKLYLILRSNEIVGGLTLLVNNECKLSEFDEIVIYNGIFFIDRQDKRLTGKRDEQFEITVFALKELEKIYDSIFMRLHYSINDIRPFLWHNYNTTENKFNLDLRYTSVLKFNINNNNLDYLLQDMSPIRRQQIRYGRESGSIVKETNDVNKFIKLYSNLLDGTENTLSNVFKERLKHLINTLIENKQAIMFECLNSDNETTYMVIFSCFNKKSTYLYGSPNISNQRAYDGTYILWESFKILFNKFKIEEVDLEGVNSPLRGFYKLTFGGSLSPYYELIYKK